MANPWAGEVELTIDGRVHSMKLTLGALAELEAGLKSEGLVDLVERFESGVFTAKDVIALLVAGLRGSGWNGSVQDLTQSDIAGGPMAAAKAAAELLMRAFQVPDETA